MVVLPISTFLHGRSLHCLLLSPDLAQNLLNDRLWAPLYYSATGLLPHLPRSCLPRCQASGRLQGQLKFEFTVHGSQQGVSSESRSTFGAALHDSQLFVAEWPSLGCVAACGITGSTFPSFGVNSSHALLSSPSSPGQGHWTKLKILKL